jgi:hypothetical protein
VFALGELFVEGKRWDYHVTTAVRSGDGRWYAVDSWAEKVMTIEAWMKLTAALAPVAQRDRVRYFRTDASKLLPLFERSEALALPYVRKYFEDLSAVTAAASR